MRIVLFDYVKVLMKTFIIVTHVPLITGGMRADLQFAFWIDQAVPFFWLISAFLFNLAFYRHGSERPRDELRKDRLVPRIKRVIVPYSIVFAALLFLVFAQSNIYASASQLIGIDIPCSRLMLLPAILVDYLCGGNGPGGYYVPMLFQMYLALPFLCAWRKRWPRATLVAGALAVVAWEIAAFLELISPQVYRLVLIRYGFYLLAGIVISDWYRKGRMGTLGFSLVGLVLFVIGACYLTSGNIWGVWLPSGEGWRNSSMLSFVYATGIMMLVMSMCYRWGPPSLLGFGGNRLPSRVSLFFESISKAALHIYIFQMLFFYFMNAHVGWFDAMGLGGSIVFSVATCTAVGYAHYAIGAYLKTKVGKRTAFKASL